MQIKWFLQRRRPRRRQVDSAAINYSALSNGQKGKPTALPTSPARAPLRSWTWRGAQRHCCWRLLWRCRRPLRTLPCPRLRRRRSGSPPHPRPGGSATCGRAGTRPPPLRSRSPGAPPPDFRAVTGGHIPGRHVVPTAVAGALSTRAAAPFRALDGRTICTVGASGRTAPCEARPASSKPACRARPSSRRPCRPPRGRTSLSRLS